MRHYTMYVAGAAIMVGLAGLSSTSAQAAVIVQTAHWGTTQQFEHVEGAGEVFLFPEPVIATTLDPFNTALGALESVAFSWIYEIAVSVTAADVPFQSHWFHISMSPSASIHQGPTTVNFGSTAEAYYWSGFLEPGAFSTSVVSSTLSPMYFTAANAGVTTNPGFWPIVSGASSFQAVLGFGPTATESYHFFRSLGVSGTVTTSIDLVATYTYSAVPAPGAAALLGLAGLVVGRRRRN